MNDLKAKVCLPETCQIDNLEKLIGKLPPEKDMTKNTKILKALSDNTRLRIVNLLREGELCVCEIMYALDKPQSTTSHHLNILKNAGLLKWRKEGIWNHYKLSDPQLVEKLDVLLSFYAGDENG